MRSESCEKRRGIYRGNGVQICHATQGAHLVVHMIQSLGCPFKGVGRKCMEPLVYGWAKIYPPPFAADGLRNIMRLLSAWAKPTCQGIYPPPFIVDGLRNIMRLLSAWAEPACQGIYPPPFIADGPRNIMRLLSAWAEPACQWIYPPPFIADGPRNIMRLLSTWAEPAC